MSMNIEMMIRMLDWKYDRWMMSMKNRIIDVVNELISTAKRINSL